jgi:hypothetical protein
MRRNPFRERRSRLTILSLAVGLVLIGLLRTFESCFEELPAALAFGGLAFVPSGKPRRVFLGALVASAGWLAGLAVSNANGLAIGLGVGTWALMSLALFSIVGVEFIKEKMILRGVLIGFFGLAVGLGIEVLQILPSFVRPLRFQDSQALGILGAAVLIAPTLAQLDGGGFGEENP